MSLKNIPGWLQDLAGGFIVGVWLWVISGVPYVRVIPILMTVALEALRRFILVIIIVPVLGYPKPNFLGFDFSSTVYYLIPTSMIVGALLMSKYKVLKYIGIFLLVIWALGLLLAFAAAQ